MKPSRTSIRSLLTLFIWFHGLALFGSPEELDDIKAFLVHSAEELGQAGADQQSIVDRVCQQLWWTELSPNELKDLMDWTKARPEISLIPKIWAEHQIAQERRDSLMGKGPGFGAWMLGHELNHLVRPKPEDRILFVGSGPLPSATFMRRMTTAKIALCDCDAEALKISRELIRRRGWESRFEFVHRSVHDLDDVSQYTLIWIATMVPDKYRALDVLGKTVSKDTQVVVRQATGTKQLFILPYEDLSRHRRFFPKSSTSTERCESQLLQAR